MLVILNPVAGARRRAGRMLDALAAAGLRFSCAETTRPGDAERLAREAAQAGARLVVAAGGDGTIAEVANGIAGSETRLGVIPLGTANVFARDLGLPFDPAGIAAVLARGRERRVIPGAARFACGRVRLFVQMLGVGLDAAVVAAVDGALKRRLGRAAYVVETLRALTRWPFPRLSLALDGTALEAVQVIATKGRFYGGPFLLAPEASAEAPGLTVCLWPRGGRASALVAALALPVGLLPRLGGMVRRRATALAVAAPAGLPVQADGDPIGATPVRVTDAPYPLPVLV